MKNKLLDTETIDDELVNAKEYTALPKHLRENGEMIKLLNAKFQHEKFIATIIQNEYWKNFGIIGEDFEEEGTAYRRLGKTETIEEYFEDKGNADFFNYYSGCYGRDYKEYLLVTEKIEECKAMLGNDKVREEDQIFKRKQLDKMFSEKNVNIIKDNVASRMRS